MLLCLHVKELQTTETSENNSAEVEKKVMEPVQQISSKWAYFMLSLVLIYAFVFTCEGAKDDRKSRKRTHGGGEKGMEPVQQISIKWASFMLGFVIIYAFVFKGEDN